MNSLVCAIAGAISAYGAVRCQAEDPAGMYLLLAGLVIIILTLVKEFVPDDPST